MKEKHICCVSFCRSRHGKHLILKDIQRKMQTRLVFESVLIDINRYVDEESKWRENAMTAK